MACRGVTSSSPRAGTVLLRRVRSVHRARSRQEAAAAHFICAVHQLFVVRQIICNCSRAAAECALACVSGQRPTASGLTLAR